MTAELDPPFCFCQKIATIQLDHGRIIYECHHAPIKRLSVPCRDAPTQEDPSEQGKEQGQEQGKEQEKNQEKNQEKERCEPSDGSHDETLNDAHPLSRLTREKGTHPHAAVDNQISDIAPGREEDLQFALDPIQERKAATYRFFHPKSSQPTYQRQQANSINTTISDSGINHRKYQTKIRGPKVCGFHMHLNEWTLYLRPLWKSEHLRTDSLLRPKAKETKDRKGEKEKDEDDDEMDKVLELFSQHHHEIVHKHPTLHSTLIALSASSRCMSHIITVGRWLGQSQAIGSPEHSTSTLPRCFCGQSMLATTIRAGFEPEEFYVCRVRRTGKGGCGRTIRIQDAMINAHTSVKATPTRPTIATPTPTERKIIATPMKPQQKPQEQDLLDAMSLSAPGVWESIESKCKSEWKPLSSHNGASSWEGDLMGDDSWGADDNWAGTSWVVPMEELSKPVFRSASLPARVVAGAFGALERLKVSTTLNNTLTTSGKTLTTSDKVVVHDASNNNNNNKGKGKDLTMDDYIDHLEWALNPRMADTGKKVETIQTASEVFEDSITRLDQRIKVMQVEGLDNPRFECRQCQDGSLDHAIVPCYHLVMCDKCIDASKECIICREPIGGMRRVYWG